MRETDERVRQTVILALGGSGNPRAIPCLLAVLTEAEKNEQWPTWIAAANALGALRAAEAVEPFVEFFSRGACSSLLDVQEAALRAVGQIGQGRGALITLYQAGDRRGMLTEEMKSCLRQIGAAAIEPLRIEFMTRRWPSIAEALSLLGWQPSTRDERILWGLALPKYDLLVSEGAAAAEPMRDWFTECRFDAGERWEILKHFPMLPAEAVGRVIVDLLKSVDSLSWERSHQKDQETRQLVALLGQKRAAQGVPWLIDLLPWSVAKDDLVDLAVKALIEIGDASSAFVQEALVANRIHTRPGLTVLRQVGATRVEPGLVSLLGNPDPEIRRLSREILESLAWQPTSPEEIALVHMARGEWVQAVGVGLDMKAPLLEALRSAHVYRQETSLFQAVALTRDVALVDRLIECAMSGTDDCVAAATDALVELGELALPGLLKKLDGAFAPEAEAAAAVLAKIGAPAVTELLARLPDPARRGPASQALHAMGWRAESSKQAVAIAIARGNFAAAGELGAVATGPLIAEWQNADPARCEAIAKALGSAGGPAAVSYLLDVLQKLPSFMPAWGAAAISLGQLRDPTSLPVLLDCLEKTTGGDRVAVATALGKFGDPAALTPLLKLLDDRDPVVCAAAASALAELGDRRAIEPLVQMLSRDLRDSYESYKNVEACRASAAATLGRFGDLCVLDPLLKAIEYHKSGPVYEGALASIRALGDPALTVLSARLQDVSERHRPTIVLAIGQFSVALVQPTLVNSLQDVGVREESAYVAHDAVRRMAAQVLLAQGWHPADDVQRAWLAIAQEDWKAAADVGAPAIDPLVQLIAGYDSNLGQAKSALGYMRGPEVFPPLRELLKHPLEHVRDAALHAVAQCGDDLVVETLVAILEDASTTAAVEANILRHMGRIGDPRALNSMLARLDIEPLRTEVNSALSTMAEGHAEVTLQLAARLLPTQPTPGRLRIISLLRDSFYPHESRVELLESLVEDRVDEVREAALKALEATVWVPTRPAHCLLAAIREVERGQFYHPHKLANHLRIVLGETPTPILRRVQALQNIVHEKYQTRQVDANNQDAGHVVKGPFVSHATKFDAARQLAREELQRRRADEA